VALLHFFFNFATLADGSGGEEIAGVCLMELRTDTPRKFAQLRFSNACAQCGKPIFMPDWSEYLNEHRVRHLWECDACGYQYETLVTFPAL
jgi:hypothetical protein